MNKQLRKREGQEQKAKGRAAAPGPPRPLFPCGSLTSCPPKGSLFIWESGPGGGEGTFRVRGAARRLYVSTDATRATPGVRRTLNQLSSCTATQMEREPAGAGREPADPELWLHPHGSWRKQGLPVQGGRTHSSSWARLQHSGKRRFPSQPHALAAGAHQLGFGLCCCCCCLAV